MERLSRKNSLATKNTCSLMGVIPKNPDDLLNMRAFSSRLNESGSFETVSVRMRAGGFRIKFIFEEREYKADIYVRATAYCRYNSELYLPLSLFIDKFDVRERAPELCVEMVFGRDFSKSYYVQLKLIHTLIPDCTAVFDHSRLFVISPEWLKHNAEHFFPNPYTMVHVFFCETLDRDEYGLPKRVTVTTKGLSQIGLREFEAAVSDPTAKLDENDDECADKTAFMLLDIAVQFILFRERLPAEYEPIPIGYYYESEDPDAEESETIYAAWRHNRSNAEILAYPCGTTETEYDPSQAVPLGDIFEQWAADGKPFRFQRIGFIGDEYNSYLVTTRADITFDALCKRVKALSAHKNTEILLRIKMVFNEYSEGAENFVNGCTEHDDDEYDDYDSEWDGSYNDFDFETFNEELREDFRDEYEYSDEDDEEDECGDDYDDDDDILYEEIWFKVNFNSEDMTCVPETDCSCNENIREGREISFTELDGRPVTDYEIIVTGVENGTRAEKVFGVNDAYLFI